MLHRILSELLEPVALAWSGLLVGMVTSPSFPVIRKQWHAVIIVVTTLATVFGGGASFALIGSGWAEMPGKIDLTIERVEALESTSRETRNLLCEIRREQQGISGVGCWREDPR